MTHATKNEVGVDGDEEFIEYMHAFCNLVVENMENSITSGDMQRVTYYKGMLYALKSVSQVYEDLIKGNLI